MYCKYACTATPVLYYQIVKSQMLFMNESYDICLTGKCACGYINNFDQVQ